jgi:phage/plasmid primase, P4 family, C-terminal domain
LRSIKHKKAQKSFLLVGKKDSGKSTLLYVVNDVLLGKENVSTLSWHAMDDKFQTFQLFGKLANIFADLPSRDLQDSGIFKAITGEDYIMGERKHKDGFSFKPFARLLFSCNKIPKNYNDRTDAFYGRLILIRFDHSFPENKQDKSLKEKLMTEADGILMWALIGLKRLMENNYVFSETDRTRAEMKKYMNESSTALTFLDEECETELGYESFRDDVYNAYTEFCSANGSKPMSKIRFNDEVADHYGEAVQRCQIMNRRSWRGLRLKQ